MIWLAILIYTWHTNPPKVDVNQRTFASAAECRQHLMQAADIVCCVPFKPSEPSAYVGEGFCARPAVIHGVLRPPGDSK